MFLNVSCYYLIPGSLKPEATENFVSPIKSIQEKITTVSEKAYYEKMAFELCIYPFLPLSFLPFSIPYSG